MGDVRLAIYTLNKDTLTHLAVTFSLFPLHQETTPLSFQSVIRHYIAV